MNRISKFNDLGLQTKLVIVYVVSMLLILILNLFIYGNINGILKKFDKIYDGNVKLNELSESLNQVQNNMTDYLNTKTTDSMDAYYKACQDYTKQIDNLSEVVSSDETLRLEKNIKEMSLEYLEQTNRAIEAKRGRNIEKYKLYSTNAKKIYGYILSYVDRLNNLRFANNSSNYKSLSVSLRYLEVVNTIVFIAVVMINIVIVGIILGNITKPLKSLAVVANEVASGNLEVEPLMVESKDEVGVVGSTFNHMIVSIKDNIEQLKESMDNERILKEKEFMMENSLKDAQLKYLQTQINPHFLFNTLNAGAQLAMMEGADRTYEYVQTVADFFRYNIKKNHDSVSLKEELNLVDNYIYILNVRFAGDIKYVSNIDEGLLGITVPSMILQPIIENSVNYGIRDIDWEGVISLSVYEKNNKAYISIEDNGVGISKEKIEKIMNSENLDDIRSESERDSNGIGLDNVIRRLKLYYNSDDVFDISSLGKNQGTKVLLKLPILKEEA
ncbi:MAG: histidine kinase [Lachnospiraceae bacterium]|nr:histidine kinase [Lachnospiraceae bacterium]